MRADGTHRVALTHYAGGTLQAFADGWSPNGKQVVFHRMAYSGSHTEVGGFYVLNLSLKHIINTSKRIRRLTPVRLRSTKGSKDENTSFGFWPSGFPAPDNVSFPYLGPTIEAQRGNPVSVTVTNKLYQEGLDPSAPAECQALGLRVIHPLASYFDPTIEGTELPNEYAPATATHLHGGHTPVAFDGEPTDIYRPAIVGDRNDYGAGTGSFTYEYPNDQEATTLWYHDHALADTRFNPMAGLAAFYLVRDQWDTGRPGNPLGLPANGNFSTLGADGDTAVLQPMSAPG